MHPDVRGGVGDGPVFWSVTITEEPGTLLIRRTPWDSVRRSSRQRDIRWAVPSWSEVITSDPTQFEGVDYWPLDECASGWPLISLRCSLNPQEIAILSANASQLPNHVLVSADRIVFVLHDGTQITACERTPGDGVCDGILVSATIDSLFFASLASLRVLPLLPIWPAFVINTLFYAAILWLLIRGPFVLRRYRRIKRGLCPGCAYPIGTSDLCTECGSAVHSRKSTSAAAASSTGGPSNGWHW